MEVPIIKFLKYVGAVGWGEDSTKVVFPGLDSRAPLLVHPLTSLNSHIASTYKDQPEPLLNHIPVPSRALDLSTEKIPKHTKSNPN